ncbi:MAG: hypothetical protein LBT97_09845 [Planctomycetota bacterium]|nr:hypothetical protein [Planctomycetota bacterium]
MLNADPRNQERRRRFAPKHGTYGVFELPDDAVVRHHAPERVGEIVGRFEPLHRQRTVFATMNGNRSNGFTFVGRKIRTGN